MAFTLMIFIIGGSRKQLVPHGIQNVAEVGIDFVRDQVVMQTIGSDGLVFLPYLTALFFFIFFSNIFEIIPYFQFPGERADRDAARARADHLRDLQRRRHRETGSVQVREERDRSRPACRRRSCRSS